MPDRGSYPFSCATPDHCENETLSQPGQYPMTCYYIQYFSRSKANNLEMVIAHTEENSGRVGCCIDHSIDKEERWGHTIGRGLRSRSATKRRGIPLLRKPVHYCSARGRGWNEIDIGEKTRALRSTASRRKGISIPKSPMGHRFTMGCVGNDLVLSGKVEHIPWGPS